MSAEQSAALAEFARACKAAARSVSLYPGTHPAIRSALGRVSATAARLTGAGDVTLEVHPDRLTVDGRSPARPDPAIAELASLLHERLVGELTMARDAGADDWLALLLLLAKAPEDLVAAGGIGRAWSASGRTGFTIREIDYAEVLRERSGGDAAEWDRIIASCLRGDQVRFDERALAALVAALGDRERFAEFLERFEHSAVSGAASLGARAAALIHLLRTALDAARARGAEVEEQALETIAASSARLTPEMMLALLDQRTSPEPADAAMANAVVDRMTDSTMASFVANSVLAERGATERLAHAFEALVPEADRKERVLELAGETARQTAAGRDEGFEDLWKGAASMLTSYSDEKYVSDAYARELSLARTHAVEVERVADDPPDRVRQWVGSVSDDAIRRLDLALVTDLVRLEDDPVLWADVAGIAAREIERRSSAGDIEAAQQLAEAVLRERGPAGRPQLAKTSSSVADQLAAGPLVRHIVQHLRKADEKTVAALARLCLTVGPGVVRPLAVAIATEENNRTIRALGEILLGFGAAGRQSVEQLKGSSNPAVRRTAIDLLRVLGGDEALPELASMLGDADEQVQREAIRAIVQIGTPKAYAVLERAVASNSAARNTILEHLLGLREDNAAPLLCFVLNHTEPKGRMVRTHAEIIEALGNLKPHPDTTRTLRDALHRGAWWAPFSTTALREAAADALLRLGTPEASSVLEEAARTGSRGVRRIARTRADLATRRERQERRQGVPGDREERRQGVPGDDKERT
jgi:hypothetical protein